MRIIKAISGILLVPFAALLVVAALVLYALERVSPRSDMKEAREFISKQGRLEWFSAAARSAIFSSSNREDMIQQIMSQMPGFPGHGPFSCRIEKETTTGKEVLVGFWLDGLSGTGVMIGGTNFIPASAAWREPTRYHFEHLTNGVYLFYTSI